MGNDVVVVGSSGWQDHQSMSWQRASCLPDTLQLQCLLETTNNRAVGLSLLRQQTRLDPK